MLNEGESQLFFNDEMRVTITKILEESKSFMISYNQERGSDGFICDDNSYMSFYIK
jgi:hypothetical protein